MPTRKMPQNLEAEMSVLGVAFLNKNAVVKICDELYEDTGFECQADFEDSFLRTTEWFEQEGLIERKKIRR